MGVGGQRHAAATLPPGKTRYPFYKRLGGRQGRSGRLHKNLHTLGCDPWTSQRVTIFYTDWATPTAREQLISVEITEVINWKAFLTSMCLVRLKLVSLNTLSWLFSPVAQQPLMGQRPPHYPGFTITFRHTTIIRTPLEEWSVRRRDLYLTTHNTHNRQTSMPPSGFEPTIPASERPQTHTVDRAAIGIRAVFFNSMRLRQTSTNTSKNECATGYGNFLVH
jgi:hypothetical protein